MKRLDPKNWNEQTAAHLLGRAGFGATPEQVTAAAAKPMQDVVDGLFKPTATAQPPSWVEPGVEFRPNFRDLNTVLTDEERRRYRQLFQRESRQQAIELIGWWLDLMLNSPDPLREKMTLFWHGHFATSIRKVRAPYMMYLQNQMFRDNALGNWGDLVTAVSQDPAMLVYLDNTQSKASAPNENYARELMELFTLGEGHYSEQDIKEAARALTGWMVDPREYKFVDAAAAQPATRAGRNVRNRLHDRGEKTFFGQSGTFDGHDVIRIILEQDQAARFITAKLWRFYAYAEPEPEVVDTLAATLRDNNYDLEALMRFIFTSEAFYSDKAMMTQIKSPTRWFIGSCIALDVDTIEARRASQALESLGQTLFSPPNVKGWDGGYSWITTSSLTMRYNLANQLINARTRNPPKEGQRRPRFGPYAADVNTILPKEKRTDAKTATDYLVERFYLSPPSAAERERLDDFIASQPPPAQWTDTQTRNVLHAIMSTPRYQLT